MLAQLFTPVFAADGSKPPPLASSHGVKHPSPRRPPAPVPLAAARPLRVPLSPSRRGRSPSPFRRLPSQHGSIAPEFVCQRDSPPVLDGRRARTPSSRPMSRGRSPSPDVRPPSVSGARVARVPGPALEKALRWDYDFPHNKWQSSAMLVSIDQQSFQKGSIRYAHHMVDEKGRRYVAKTCIKPPASNKEYFENVAMQAACQYFAMAYNRRGPPKLVSFIDSFVLQLTDREGRHFMTCEEYLPGVYAKYNNNGGWRSDDDRNTPQAFSHFTYNYAQGKIIIVDIQGVGDRYTDPQLHSLKQRYGLADLGALGIQLFFQTHQCNSICKGLHLTDQPVDTKGTLMH